MLCSCNKGRKQECFPGIFWFQIKNFQISALFFSRFKLVKLRGQRIERKSQCLTYFRVQLNAALMEMQQLCHLFLLSFSLLLTAQTVEKTIRRFFMKKVWLTLAAFAAIGLGFSTTTAQADTIYTVKKGDTLSGILFDLHGSLTGMDQLAQTNEINNLDLIFIGQKLTVDAAGQVSEATPEEVAEGQEADTIKEAAEQTEEPVEEAAAEQPAESQEQVSGRQLTVQTTAYDGVSLGGVTATGNIIATTDDKVIAVDPNVIPLGSKVYIPGYGTAVAWDTGGAINGHIIDLNMSTADAIQWGRRTVTVTILD
ncbi:hypothetical protein CBF27_04340 [Vagococcus acidifermentans]|uniref:LysM domain-containing protein n=2 Tax=Vagococcus acidifermentans TaxID=564710 RepID=A0A430AZC2_9ENTE|nr:hypothetical protein CBF27_04340 [Vagococcus acidifermentans]